MTVAAAPRERPPEIERRPSTVSTARPERASLGPWMRLFALILVAVASELLYVGFWPLSYYLSQGIDYTHEYLLQYPAVWERLFPLLLRFEATWPEGSRSLPSLVNLLLGAFLVAFAFYLIAFVLTRAGLPSGWGVAAVVAPAVAFQATLFLMPGLFTTDLFSYVMYGQIAGPYGLNPYIHLPAYFPQNRVFHWIHPIWHHAPSVYGPVWLDFSWGMGRWIGAWGEVDKVLAYKLAINLAHLGGIGFLALAVHRLRPGKVLPSVLLYAWNPLILFEFGGNGHNDAVMVSLMLLAVALFAGQERLAGLVALTVSLLIKMSSVLLLPYLVIAWARERRTLASFVGVLAVSGATVLTVVVSLYLPWWVGTETIAPILVWSQGPMYNNYVPDFLAQRVAFEYLFPAVPDPTAALEQARGWVKTLTRVMFAAYCAWELVKVHDGRSLAGAGARVMLGFLLIGNTWVLPWYFTWPVALAIVHGWESLTGKLLLGFSLTAPIAMYYNHFWHPYTQRTVYLLYLAPLVLLPLAWLSRLAAQVSARRARSASARDRHRFGLEESAAAGLTAGRAHHPPAPLGDSDA